MSDTDRLKARSPRGFADRGAAELSATRAMMEAIRQVYELWGFEEVETPFVEYTDALGKFLPDQDRPNAGVFSFKDDDEQWLSLRYDLTAPLARFVAQNFDALPKPYRSYRSGPVFRNEKPGPGRFRQFLQFDADIVGAASVAADADICMMAADTLEAVGIARGDYLVKVNNRKVLDGVMEVVGLSGPENAARRLIVLRAIDKLDRLGVEGVQALLGAGRKDESGDFTKGAGLSEEQIVKIIAFVTAQSSDTVTTIANLGTLVVNSEIGEAGVAELAEIAGLVAAAGYEDRVRIDPSVVRGLEYYTGPVYEAELTFEITDEDGRLVRFGSVAGGGRYDGLVARFRGEPVPATGFSIGVSRLQAALAALGQDQRATGRGPVVVLVLDRDHLATYQALARELRDAGIRAEIYLGSSGMKAQMKYADRRHAPVAVIQGSDERERGEVTIKDLVAGARLAQTITDRAEWTEARPAQITVPKEEMVGAIRDILGASSNVT
ncbi:histidine--tRNA ligase [Agaricicola taiwanensis]|uniref:Histidine--tRNA ligase n=1 Tax=Agaricicola taiwanensis TaxID=591372 RepID=A0A8J2VP99_9RHOB|nr:histidine--tRNA ligase [Agaricicola taiwanensis]GGE34208.1 histidine--tRNA ligase [Agaricicola taiwanensis]